MVILHAYSAGSRFPDYLARALVMPNRTAVTTHVRAVMQDAAVLAEEVRLPAEERAVLTIAAAAHDVVYDGHPGETSAAAHRGHATS